MAKLNELVGKTLTEIKNNDDELIFIANDGSSFKMYHSQDKVRDSSSLQSEETVS